MHLADIPVEVFLHHLLPFVEVRDVLNLGSTNKFFAALTADDPFWKRKCQADFDFTSLETARQFGWKNLYRSLNHPKVFVWGAHSNGRLGVTKVPDGCRQGVPYPIEVKVPGSRIVSLVASSSSCHAIDSKGSMYIWGTLKGDVKPLTDGGFCKETRSAEEPHRLLMPNPIRTVSCGAEYTMALDAKNQVWTFVNWGRPFRLDTPLLDCTSPETTPIQVECGWLISFILTESGDVLFFCPFFDEIRILYEEENAAMDERGDCHAYPTSDNCIPCVYWSLRADPMRTPHIPQLPELQDAGLTQEKSKPTTLVKIAAFDEYIIGLTNKGHVLKFDASPAYSAVLTMRWQYLENFSELSKVSAHPQFRDENASSKAPTSLRITHITAAVDTFVAISTGSSSIVLMGDIGTNEDSQPNIIPELQNRSVIDAAIGEFHYGALTADGQLLTWGNYPSESLGLGTFSDDGYYTTQYETQGLVWGPHQSARVFAPSPVHFNHGPNPGGRRYCFAATAGGYHMGALVICLEPEKEVYDDASSSAEDSRFL